jgi:hypothetical protein
MGIIGTIAPLGASPEAGGAGGTTMDSVRIKGYVYVDEDTYGLYGPAGSLRYFVLDEPDRDANVWGACLGPVEFDFRPSQNIQAVLLNAKIGALEAEKARIGKEFAARTAQINNKIAELQAITMGEQA